MMETEEPHGLLSKLLVILGLRSKRVSSRSSARLSLSQCVRRLDVMEKKAEEMEQVTMTWTMDDLTDEQKREMGIE